MTKIRYLTSELREYSRNLLRRVEASEYIKTEPMVGVEQLDFLKWS